MFGGPGCSCPSKAFKKSKRLCRTPTSPTSAYHNDIPPSPTSGQRTVVVELSKALEVEDVFEHEGVLGVVLLSNFVVHGVDVCLVRLHAALRQRAGVVDGHPV